MQDKGEIYYKGRAYVLGRAFHGYSVALRHTEEDGILDVYFCHQRIAHITGIISHQDAVERRKGYEQALSDAGLELNPELIIEGDFLEQSGLLAVEMLFTRAHPFSAIFAANNQIAYGVLLGLYRRGIRVPDDISLIGFDDQRTSAYTTPPLTTIRQPPIEIGETAAQAILHLLKDKPFTMPEFLAKLVVRESVVRYR